MSLTSFPPVRQIVIGGPKAGGPPVYNLNFNLTFGTLELYSLATHELEIKNLAPHPITYTIEFPTSQWRQVEVQPTSDTIIAGQSQTVTVSLLALHPHHMAFMGRMTIQGGPANKPPLDPVYLCIYGRAVDCVVPECEIEWSRLTGGDAVAKGAAGQVNKLTLDGKVVAVKQFFGLEALESVETVVSEFYREIKVLSLLKHPNIVKFVGASSKFPHLAVVMEFAPYGSLSGVLANTDIVVDWKLRVKFGMDIAKGLHYLHLNRVAHRDLKSPNILILSLNSSESIVSAVVTDFNASKFGQRTRAVEAPVAPGGKPSLVKLIGTTAWCSPEALKGATPDEKNDVFSYGIILWEIAARKLPYLHLRFEYQVADFVCSGNRMDMPAYCFPPWAQMTLACWAQNPTDRPSIPACMQDLARMQRRLTERGPPEIDYSSMANPAVKKYNVLWVDDKGRERGILIAMWTPQRPDINFLSFDSTVAMKAWIKKNEDEIAFRGGDVVLRVITNRFREKDGGENAAENLIHWLRNPSECPFPKAQALIYCSNTVPLQHLQSRLTLLSSLPNITQRFALFEDHPPPVPPAVP